MTSAASACTVVGFSSLAEKRNTSLASDAVTLLSSVTSPGIIFCCGTVVVSVAVVVVMVVSAGAVVVCFFVVLVVLSFVC